MTHVMNAAAEMSTKPLAAYAEDDKLDLHRFKADEACRIEKGLSPVGAYLNLSKIIHAAKMPGADEVYPGYGLLFENPNVVDA